MIIYNNDMILLAIGKAFLKMSLAWFITFGTLQNLINNDIFEDIVSKMPSKVLMFFGFFYLVFIVVKKGHDTWTHIQLNRMKMDKERQKVKQEEIHTESDKKELNE